MPNVERRRALRFDLQLPITVRWIHDSVTREAVSMSENVGSRGICFSLPEGVKKGISIEIVMTLPHEITLAGNLRVRCMGRTLRCELQQGGRGNAVVAVSIEKYEFLRTKEDTEQKGFCLN